jgi:hypothetical protein
VISIGVNKWGWHFNAENYRREFWRDGVVVFWIDEDLWDDYRDYMNEGLIARVERLEDGFRIPVPARVRWRVS